MNLFRKKKLSTEERKRKFYKKLKISDNDDQDTKTKLMTYIQKGKNLDLVYLPEVIQNDFVFMAGLYNTNTEINNFYKPNENLQSNTMFMLAYVRTMVNHYTNNNHTFDQALTMTLNDSCSSLKNMEFVEKLIEYYPNVRVLNSVKECLLQSTALYINKRNYERFKYIIENLSSKSFADYARQHGNEVLDYIFENNPHFLPVVQEAVKKDGFKTIKKINPIIVKNNISLLLSATKISGVDSLTDYINNYLDSNNNMLKVYGITNFDDFKKSFLENDKIKELITKKEAEDSLKYVCRDFF